MEIRSLYQGDRSTDKLILTTFDRAGAVINVLRPRPQDSLVVFGLGAVGFASLFAAAYLNVSKIIVVDLVPSRQTLALELGAHHALDGSRTDLAAEIKRLTGGGATYSIEATGVISVLRTAWECLEYSGTVVSIGNLGPGHLPPFDVHDMVNSGKAWRGCVEGDSNPPEFIPLLMKSARNSLCSSRETVTYHRSSF